MSNQYVRIPNQSDRHNRLELDDEVQAAFDYREEDDDDHHDASESQPLNPNASRAGGATTHPPPPPIQTYQQGSYNFDSVDYDFPPPGSPPPLSATAFPNEIGNSNGYVPEFNGRAHPPPQQPWWKRAATSVLPEAVGNRLGLSSNRPPGTVGSGINNDGVFANVVAKPTAPTRIQQDNGETYIVPEDAQNEAPPSYASAQADAVPPYWETTVHAPFSSDSIGEMIVDSLPTGTLFSFCWNMLVSISFQFVGFLLTYLLHTSHAARLGSRAGLGVTLIQYGFALRSRLDSSDDSSSQDGWSNWEGTFSLQTDTATPTSTSTALGPASSMAAYPSHNGTGMLSQEEAGMIMDATTEWLSFFMMTIGWFILLTSLLGFYRVKRWERGILASQQASEAPRDAPTQTPGTAVTFIAPFEQAFALQGMSRIELLRQGLGMRRRSAEGDAEVLQPLTDAELSRAESGEQPTIHVHGDDVIIAPPLDPNDPRTPAIIRAMEQEASMRHSLRAAGFM